LQRFLFVIEIFILFANSTHEKSNHLFFSCISFIASHAQMEVGYNTTDVGAEFQWYKDGKFIGLHLATNAKLHHSFMPRSVIIWQAILRLLFIII
jgi:hypothetical protein